MRHLQTEILVIGGGATGTGVLRDLAMRGFKCILVERRDLAYGTTGRYHGVLHSGGRYAVNDPQAASECYEENLILHSIMPQCIEDTGGYFVVTPQDDPAYVSKFIAGCSIAGIPLVSIPISEMLKQEPLLNPKIQQCFKLPDASADSFLATQLNADSACQYGGQVLVYHEISSLIVGHHEFTGQPAVTGAMCRDLVKDEDVQIDASLVVNASGAWAGKIAHTAGIDLQMVPGKGTMLALNHRIVNTIVNRCKLPSDGDILVPAHTVAVIGTTDIRVVDPDQYAIEPWEIRLLLDEGEKIVPQFKQFRILRAWAGVRPLVQGKNGVTDRDISRAFILLDHAERDGLDGIITITSGKWTTYRKMAQVTVDKVCEKLKVNRPCRTHLEVLPAQPAFKENHHYLGARLEKIEQDEMYGKLICECELVSEHDIEHSIIYSDSKTLDDVRRDTRLGMGPCQGAFCTFRATGMLHSYRRPPVTETNVLLRDFLQERWKGNLPVLWGQQLRQARFNELIYVDVLNATSLPGEQESKLAADEYSRPEVDKFNDLKAERQSFVKFTTLSHSHPQDILVIGAGFAGLFAGWQASLRGRKTRVISKGWGTPYWSSGCIDIFGYQPPDYSRIIDSPSRFLEKYVQSNPHHPYSLVGLSRLEKAIQSFLAVVKEARYPYYGSMDAMILIPTALGTLRPTCLVPDTMLAGDASQNSPMLIVGFSGYHDFFPTLVADNLSAQGILTRELILDLKSLSQRKFITSMTLARRFDEPEFRQEVIDAIKPKLSHIARVGFPAVLGLQHAGQVKAHLEASLGLPVFEIPGLPPSVPGIRLQNLLINKIENQGSVIFNGMSVSDVSIDDKKISAIYTETASRKIAHQANAYILATGGILGGGITLSNNGYAQETVFGLPIHSSEPHNRRFHNRFLSNHGHPIFSSGSCVDEAFQPVEGISQVIFDNLYAVGNALGNCDPVRERSLEGIALATSFAVVEGLDKDMPL